MGTKTVSIREDVYETLKSMKREDESISDAVERLISYKKREANLGEKGQIILPEKIREKEVWNNGTH